MSREIKFRVWDNDLKHYLPTDGGVWFDIPSEYGSLTKANLSALIKSVNAFSVQQYTGMKDKKGKEIYEGDILKCPWEFCDGENYEVGEVVYWEGEFLLSKGEEKDIPEYVPYDFFSHNETPTTKFFWKRAEIIGNKFENPELLKNNESIKRLKNT